MIRAQALAAAALGILSLLYYAFVNEPSYIPNAIFWSVYAATMVVSFYWPFKYE